MNQILLTEKAMLLWRLLIDAAEANRIDRYSVRARAWIRRRLPGLVQILDSACTLARQPIPFATSGGVVCRRAVALFGQHAMFGSCRSSMIFSVRLQPAYCGHLGSNVRGSRFRSQIPDQADRTAIPFRLRQRGSEPDIQFTASSLMHVERTLRASVMES